jgi:hypothetical protein
VVVTGLVALPTLLLACGYSTQFLSDIANDYVTLFYVVVSASFGLAAGFLACRLAGLLGVGASAIGAAIGVLTVFFAWIVQQVLQAQLEVGLYWGSPFLGTSYTPIGRTVYYAASMALAALAGNLLAQMLAGPIAARRGVLASLTANQTAAILGGIVLAAAGSYIAFRFALYPYCLGHTPFTVLGLCSST